MTKITLDADTLLNFLNGELVMLFIREEEGYNDTTIEEALVNDWPNVNAFYELHLQTGLQELMVNGTLYKVFIEVHGSDPEGEPSEYREEWYMQRRE